MESCKSDNGTNRSAEFIENSETSLQGISTAETGNWDTEQMCTTSLTNSTKWKLYLRSHASVI